MTRHLLALVIVAVVVASLGWVKNAHAVERLEEVFERGNKAYYEGDYEGAAQAYAHLVDAGIDDPDLYFNLATTFAQLRDYGRAIQFYERTVRLRPGDDGAEAGIASAKRALGQLRANSEGEAVVEEGPPLTEALTRSISESTIAVTVLLLDVLFFSVLIALRLFRKESVRLGLGIAAPLLGVLLLVFSVGLMAKTRMFQEGQPAVVLEEQVPLLEGPDPRAKQRGQTYEGERAYIIDEKGGYVEARLSGNRRGWLDAKQVGTI